MLGAVRVACLCAVAMGAACADGGVSEETAREKLAAYLEEKSPGLSIGAMELIPREGDDLAEVRREFTVYRATTTSKDVPHGLLVLLFDREGKMLVWDGNDRVPVLQAILERCGLRASDEASLRRAGLVCLLMPVEDKYDADRVELKDYVFTYHRHLLVLMSGRVGAYSEDVVARFDERGRLESFEVTGFQDLTVEQRDALVADPDPWLQLVGLAPDELKAKVAEKSKVRKLPIRHPEK